MRLLALTPAARSSAYSPSAFIPSLISDYTLLSTAFCLFRYWRSRLSPFLAATNPGWDRNEQDLRTQMATPWSLRLTRKRQAPMVVMTEYHAANGIATPE